MILCELLKDNNIIPNLLRDNRKMYAYHFNGYWKDVGTIPSLWEANMEVLDPEHSGINLFDENWKIYSRNSGMTGHRIGEDALRLVVLLYGGRNDIFKVVLLHISLALHAV